MLQPRTIYFDETGNTGAALDDPSQPLFALASVDFDAKESSELLAQLQTPGTAEAKFSGLRRSSVGRRKLLRFFESQDLSPERVKAVVYHKRFMAVAKAVDLLVESQLHEAGIDLYAGALNVAMSNLYYTTLPFLCGESIFDDFLGRFVALVRERTVEARGAFKNSAEALLASCRNPDLADTLWPFLEEEAIEVILQELSHLDLDPAIPAFVSLCTAWGAQLGCRFAVVHDESKPISQDLEVLEAMMDPSIASMLIGFESRQFEFPLKASGIRFARSIDEPSVQVADLVAGATAYHLSALAGARSDSFSDELHSLGRFLIGGVWPSVAVTPGELGVTSGKGVSPIDHMTASLAAAGRLRRRERREGA